MLAGLPARTTRNPFGPFPTCPQTLTDPRQLLEFAGSAWHNRAHPAAFWDSDRSAYRAGSPAREAGAGFVVGDVLRSTPSTWQSQAMTTCLVTFSPTIPRRGPKRNSQMFSATHAITPSNIATLI